ncbi:hypothetical protein PhCBS80983_g04135 [Powellomyces hirtus]|uniref:Large-conductance mechanosensitive channel n=1 Tax=Powellomyces hirtus TaxID=109895 RepID=A0A507E0U4_9FUNG|nr:hypothetical protein PhCBS80983_g04135 [Powellomyces hirtus]
MDEAERSPAPRAVPPHRLAVSRGATHYDMARTSMESVVETPYVLARTSISSGAAAVGPIETPAYVAPPDRFAIATEDPPDVGDAERGSHTESESSHDGLEPSHPTQHPQQSPLERRKSKRSVKKPHRINVTKFRRKMVKSGANAGLKSVKAAGSIIQDFRHFVLRGNVVDLAIGIIIGGAFTAIVTSLVSDIIGPIVGLALGSQLQNAFVLLREPNSVACRSNVTDCSQLKTPAQVYAAGGVTWNYGNFFQTVINFLLTASILFFLIKVYAAAVRKPLVEKKKKEKERLCPFCLKLVPLLAMKCYLCTTDLPPGSPISPSKVKAPTDTPVTAASYEQIAGRR